MRRVGTGESTGRLLLLHLLGLLLHDQLPASHELRRVVDLVERPELVLVHAKGEGHGRDGVAGLDEVALVLGAEEGELLGQGKRCSPDGGATLRGRRVADEVREEGEGRRRKTYSELGDLRSDVERCRTEESMGSWMYFFIRCMRQASAQFWPFSRQRSARSTTCCFTSCEEELVLFSRTMKAGGAVCG